MSDVWSLLTRRVDRDKPLVTWMQDDVRIELSTATLTTSVAKVANALSLELDAGPRIHLNLPWHWQLPVWQGGVWVSGRMLTLGEDADVVVVGENVTEAPSGSWAVSLHPWGLAITHDLPAGVDDVTDLVRSQPDALVITSPESYAPLDTAHDVAAELGVGPGDRLLALPGNPVIPLLVPLVSGASVLLAEAVDAVDVEREGVTHIYVP